MSNRKINQDVEKCFKQIAIGVEAFDASYEKYEQSTNASQRDKLVENIKKECKKLQRLRDQIKTWAAGNEIKDKGPLQDKRELIESVRAESYRWNDGTKLTWNLENGSIQGCRKGNEDESFLKRGIIGVSEDGSQGKREG